jgi:hypothetical protein
MGHIFICIPRATGCQSIPEAYRGSRDTHFFLMLCNAAHNAPMMMMMMMMVMMMMMMMMMMIFRMIRLMMSVMDNSDDDRTLMSSLRWKWDCVGV